MNLNPIVETSKNPSAKKPTLDVVYLISKINQTPAASYKMTQQMTSKIIITCFACLMLFVANLQTGESRYLPTRSDESDLAALRDLLETLLVEQQANANRRFNAERLNEMNTISPYSTLSRLGLANTRQMLVGSQSKPVKRLNEEGLLSDNGMPVGKDS